MKTKKCKCGSYHYESLWTEPEGIFIMCCQKCGDPYPDPTEELKKEIENWKRRFVLSERAILKEKKEISELKKGLGEVWDNIQKQKKYSTKCKSSWTDQERYWAGVRNSFSVCEKLLESKFPFLKREAVK